MTKREENARRTAERKAELAELKEILVQIDDWFDKYANEETKKEIARYKNYAKPFAKNATLDTPSKVKQYLNNVAFFLPDVYNEDN